MNILCGGPVSEFEHIFSAHIASLKIQGEMDYKGIDGSPLPLIKPEGFCKVDWRQSKNSGCYKTKKVRWRKDNLKEVATLREEMRIAALRGGYDYLFMVDSDIILSPNTLTYLLSSKKDFIAPLVWTSNKEKRYPNAWNIKGKIHGGPLSEFTLNILKCGGMCEVEMVGCCYLISKNALERISWKPISGFWREDIWVALSAKEQGIPIYITGGVTAEHRRIR